MEISYAIQKEAFRRGYSNKTIKAYCFYVDKFFKSCNKEPKKVTKVDIREYLNKLSERGKTGNTINVNLNALKFFFEEILGKNFKVNIKYSKVPKRVPIVLTKEEVKELFDVIKNEKHKLMIQLLYSAGLRISELVNLKIKDLEIDKSYGWVRHGKGKKDRLFIIADSLKDEIRKLIGIRKLNEYTYLFISNRKNKYSTRTLQQVIRNARKKANLNEKISCHTLRHSFATHLIENGYDVSQVQFLLGHKNPLTTLTYLHTAPVIKIKSPIDEL